MKKIKAMELIAANLNEIFLSIQEINGRLAKLESAASLDPPRRGPGRPPKTQESELS